MSDYDVKILSALELLLSTFKKVDISLLSLKTLLKALPGWSIVPVPQGLGSTSGHAHTRIS